MPELPEVEITRRALSVLEGAVLERLHFSGRNLRCPLPPVAHLPGGTLRAMRRRGKCLLYDFSSGSLVSHLGMSGRYRILPAGDASPLLPHDHAEFTFRDGRRAIFHDPRRFGAFTAAFPVNLGPEPFDADPAALHTLTARKNTPIKPLLLDQTFLAGVGNIYACEGMWRAKVHPQRPARTLSLDDCTQVLAGVCAVMHEAIAAGGSSFRDFASPEGKGYFHFAFSAYDRAGTVCTHCGGMIARMVQAGRSTFYCTACAA